MLNIELTIFSILVFVIIFMIILVTCIKKWRQTEATIITFINSDDNTVECPQDLQNECAICLEYFNTGDTVKIMDCGHYYHCQCIDEWLEKEGSCAKCSGENIV